MRLQDWNGDPNLRFVNTSRSIDEITGLEWSCDALIKKMLTALAQLMILKSWNGVPNLTIVNTSRSKDEMSGLEWSSKPPIR